MYEIEANVENTHWWFVGRRKLFRSIISRFGVDSGDKVLDVGTSTGTNLRLLRDMNFSNVQGVDLNPDAIRYCADKGLGNVHFGDIQNLPFDDDTFSLVLATDIIEHVQDDANAMRELTRVLAPGGRLLITVPAFMALWGHNDSTSHHQRRYTGNEISTLAQSAGLKVMQQFYFNFLLFLPIWVARQIIRRTTKVPRPENEMNSPLINTLLTMVFSLDITLAPYVRPPFGVSYLVMCEK